ncbi:c5953738-8698-4f21-96ad-6387f3b1f31c [Thermothielavioides terrestris]|uniref:C5953738-8698-4f21-96ad-6387f3b1f31c n=1 Tax=Thermothielavioides terrestris TaxID=2587410 RepID=A0A3S4BPJ0_9PEZI|nr:c5953738-8698-4f21-96ad-6387f3b1f31c [Thermothielavioides terrestris]
MHPFPVWPGVPFLWEQYKCDCYKYFQFYLCGCPDLTIAKSGRPPEHQPSIRRCAMWYKPEWEQRQAASYRFEHKPDWDLPFKQPQVLPFPCYDHWIQSRIFLDPSALGDLGRRLDNPATNPPRAARWNRNIRALQHFQEQGRTWELKKRVREVLDDPSQRPSAPANQPYTNPLFAYFSIPPAKNQSHFSSLTWLLEEQRVDLWALDGYRWLHPQPQPQPEPQQQQQQQPCAPRFDGNTHRGYAGGAYRFDLETLECSRWANWHKWDEKGRWARAVGDWFSMGGWAVEEGGLLER